MPPLVSILIPTYNRSEMLRQALGSALMQSHRQIEVLVSDNHSTDGTPAVIDEFARRDERVRRLKSPPGNASAMLNIRNAFLAAEGKFAVVLADDDFFLDYRYLEEGVRILEDRHLGLLICDCVLGRPRREVTSLRLGPVTSGRHFFLNYWRDTYSIPVISNLFDVRLARTCDPWSDPAILYADVELWLKMMTLTDVAYYEYPAVYYRFHGQNIVSTMSLPMHKQNVRFIANAAAFASPAFDERTLIEWKKDLLVEYCQLILKEGKSLRMGDLRDLRAAIGLAREGLGRRRWLRLLEYMRRHYVRTAARGWRRATSRMELIDAQPTNGF